MSEAVIENARIKSTMLGRQDHGILTGGVNLEFAVGGVQMFGGWTLDGPYMATFVARVLDVIGVDYWEKLPGMPCRAMTNGRIIAIGHFLDERWFALEELRELEATK